MASPVRKLALVIGNNEYMEGKKLRYCINDALDLKNKLHSIGFVVTAATDLTFQEMNIQINNFTRTIKPHDLVVFFFSGHGTQWHDQNFLMPIDDQKIDPLETIKFRAIHVQTTLNNFMACGPSAAILLLDCCREYLLPNEAATRGSGGNENHQGLSKINSLRGSYIAFACDAGRTTSDRSANGRNGIFTAHILQHIATPNLTFDQIMNQVCKGVVAESKEKYWPFRVTGLRSDVFLNRQVNIGESVSLITS
ncbi:unnamed protein product [Adineta steineri]|uniref:Caspase family p20 domain-containing protein n=1 Tax=Adineta steineri TaxID=433720 RepID=A0A818XGR0_9BILA|nr:unnamed protein product [Adineta steineri]CAF3739424.1 unnamed protein product [Adineta steineri]